MSAAPAPDSPFLTSSQVAAMFGVDPRTLVHWSGDPRSAFPKPIKTSGGHRRWPRAEIERYLLATRGTTEGAEQRELFIAWLRTDGWRAFQLWTEEHQ